MVRLCTPVPLILASESPRRRKLLEQAGLRFTVVPSAVDESGLPAADPALAVRRLAEAKTLAVARRFPDSWVIGADTVVCLDQQLLGKPANAAEARGMLRRLSGRSHEVFTGFCLCQRTSGHHHCQSVRTDVTFKRLSEREIDWYIASGEPFDKAGAYGIQGLGAQLISTLHGSYTNVVGLPLCEVMDALMSSGAVVIAPEPQCPAPGGGP
jgi:septum formation protein